MTTHLSAPRKTSLSPWYRRGPLNAFRDLEDMIERYWGSDGEGWAGQLLTPPLDMSETATDIELHMDLPGVNADDIDIQVSANQLTISGERKEEKEEKGEAFHRIERRQGQFSRTVMLPCAVQEDDVDAHYKDGVLHIKLPKTAESKARHI